MYKMISMFWPWIFLQWLALVQTFRCIWYSWRYIYASIGSCSSIGGSVRCLAFIEHLHELSVFNMIHLCSIGCLPLFCEWAPNEWKWVPKYKGGLINKCSENSKAGNTFLKSSLKGHSMLNTISLNCSLLLGTFCEQDAYHYGLNNYILASRW